MTERKRWTAATAMMVALAAGPLVGSAALAAGTDPAPAIPDSALLQPEDLDGVTPVPGGPDQAAHPLPPNPCADDSDAVPEAARTVRATVAGHQVYEYLARYAPGVAAQVAEDLRAEVTRCPNGPGDVRHRIVKTDLWGAYSTLLWRDWDDTNRMDTYLVGVAGDYLVVVMDTGDGIRTGDLTTTSGIGGAAIRRAGGDTSPVPTPTPSTPAPGTGWVTFEAEVTGVRAGDGPNTATVDLWVPAGGIDCARDPRVTYLSEESNRVHANLVVDSFENEESNRCVERAAATATLTATAPLGDRILVLNHQAWAPDGAGYRRCDAQLGCTPPADHCDMAWIRAGVQDIPQHSAWNLRGCDGAWAVLDIDTSAGACGPLDPGPRPGCTATPRWQRHFMRFENGWTTFSGSKVAGCAGVHAVEPDFPAALCETLPAR